MKKLNIISFLTLACSVGLSASVVKSGQVVTGYNRELEVVITKTITVTIDKSGPSILDIEDEGALAGIFEDGKLSAYPIKPKKYFYFTLELNPLKGNIEGHSRVISFQGDAKTHYCPPGANALLTGFVGDGSKKAFCVTLK